jgi:hypothetical protein
MRGHYGKCDNIIIYEEPDTKLQKAGCWMDKPDNQEEWPPEVGNFNLIYRAFKRDDEGYIVVDENDKPVMEYLYWDGQVYKPVNVYQEYLDGYYCKDWRTKLYMDGVTATLLGTDPGYYYPELCAYWPQVYDLVNQCFFGEYDEYGNPKRSANSLTNGVYYLDFIDPTRSTLSEYSVKNIGRRTNVTVNDKINCLFQPEIPNVVFINTDLSDAEKAAKREECNNEYQPWTQVSGDVFDKLATGGYHNGAFDQIKYDLYLHTRYQKSISMTTLPVYWLEPNSRIRIEESTTNTYGDFMISNINYTFGPAATMALSCSEVAERF